jgi:UDP-GlcNAc:undecaprenyl-phosphate/decaprenyl-phosphate GlcNAc-1-phosphate transferase
MIWLLAFFLSVAVGLVATRAVMSIGISDSPDADRKLHKKVTPTSGGLGIMAGFFAGCALLYWDGVLLLSTKLLCCIGVCFIGGVLGLLDDIYVLGPKRKLVVMLIATTTFVAMGARIEDLALAPGLTLLLGPIFGGIGTVFWLLVVVNSVNFMDGANGLSMGCCAISLLFLAGLGGVEGAQAPMLLALIGSAACFGFLRWNAVSGQIFAGDSGALFVGLLCGTTGAWLAASGVNPLSVALCFVPTLVDVILTVLRRIKHHEAILQAHSQHAYQALIRAGASHALVARRYWFHTFVCCLFALVGQYQGGFRSLIYFVLLLGFFCVFHFGMLNVAKDALLQDGDDVG